MGYYNDPVNRADKSGAKREIHDGFEPEIDKAKDANKYFFRSDAFAEGDGFMGVDDLDRLRRDKLKHETR